MYDYEGLYLCLCVCAHVRMYVCVSVCKPVSLWGCVCKRERERERESVSVCLSVCVHEPTCANRLSSSNILVLKITLPQFYPKQNIPNMIKTHFLLLRHCFDKYIHKLITCILHYIQPFKPHNSHSNSQSPLCLQLASGST